MYKIRLYLYIISFNLSLSEQCFVSTDETKYKPIWIEIHEPTPKSIDEILEQIFEKYVDLGFGWISTKLINVEKNNDYIDITYACSIPPNTHLKNSYYTSKNIAIIDRLARKALYYV